MLSLAAVLVALGVVGISRVLFPYDVGHYEANAWAPSLLLAHGHDPYDLTRATTAPYVAAPYGPLYYGITGLGLRVFGTQFWAVRGASLLALLGTALLVAMIVRSLAGRSNRAAMTGAVAFLASFPAIFWVGVQRPDMFAAAFSMGGLALAVVGLKSARRTTAIAAGIALAAAMLCRQTAILPLLMVLAIYLYHRDALRLLLALASFSLVTGLSLAAFEASSGNDVLQQLFATQGEAPFRTSIMWGHVESLLREPITLVTVAWLVFGFAFAGRSRAVRTTAIVPLPLLIGYLMAAVALAAITSGRAGSNLNYWLEPAAVAALVLGVIAGNVRSSRQNLILASLAVASLLSSLRVAHGEMLRWEARGYLAAVVNTVARETSPKQPSFAAYPELISKAHRQYFVNDFVQYDGRDPNLKSAYDRLLRSRQLAAIVSGATQAPAGYRRIDLGQEPSGIYPTYVYVRQGASVESR